jgi:hypothetical protein
LKSYDLGLNVAKDRNKAATPLTAVRIISLVLSSLDAFQYFRQELELDAETLRNLCYPAFAADLTDCDPQALRELD